MSTATGSFVISQSTDAEFRVWCAGVIALINATGVTQTSDTGQINTATVVKPAAINTAQGYAIFRFNDTLHGTRPIFFKVEFGSGSATTNPSMWLTVGTGSDGAGTITSIAKARLQRSMSPTLVATNSLACYNTAIGMFWFNVNTGPLSGGNFFHAIIARTCDSNGAPDSYGMASAFVQLGQDIKSYHWATSTEITVWPAHNPMSSPTASTILRDDAGRAVVLPSVIMVNNVAKFLTGILVCNFLEFPTQTVVAASPFGTEYNYIALTGFGYPNGWEPAGDTDTRALVIWQ